jgi:hypothetical protein
MSSSANRGRGDEKFGQKPSSFLTTAISKPDEQKGQKPKAGQKPNEALIPVRPTPPRLPDPPAKK